MWAISGVSPASPWLRYRDILDNRGVPPARQRAFWNFNRYSNPAVAGLLDQFVWFFGAFWAALVLNFFLPRLIPGNPVDTLVARLASGGLEGQAAKQVYAAYIIKFGLDQPVWVQFWLYVQALAHGDLGQ